MEDEIVHACVCLEESLDLNQVHYLEDTPRTFFKRLRGLIGKSRDGIYCFENCSSIHTIGMTHAIDIAFVSRRGNVMKVQRNVSPWRFASCKGAYLTLERFASQKPWFFENQEINVCNYRSSEGRTWMSLKTS